MVTWRSLFNRHRAPEPKPEPAIRAIFCHLGTDIVVRVSDRIQAITVPVFADGQLIEYRYNRTDECLPVDDGLAVIFR